MVVRSMQPGSSYLLLDLSLVDVGQSGRDICTTHQSGTVEVMHLLTWVVFRQRVGGRQAIGQVIDRKQGGVVDR